MNTFDPVNFSICQHAHQMGVEADKEADREDRLDERYNDYLNGEEDEVAEALLIQFEEETEPEEDYFVRLLKAESDDDILAIAKEMREKLDENVRTIIDDTTE
mgnify:CR=1 FL=1